MIEKQVKSILKELSEKNAPKAKINLWPGIESRIVKEGDQMREVIQRSEPTIGSSRNRIPRLRLAATFTLVGLLVIGLFFISPLGQGLAQNILRYFTRSESNQLPIQAFQLTPPVNTTNPTSDPAGIIYAKASIDEVQQQAGFNVLIPSWIPNNLSFSGASFDKENGSVRIFYQFFETNGLVFVQEPIPMSLPCELCDKVGADGVIKEVSIDGYYGEYVEGVWKLTENGPVWESDPYLKTLRWQVGEMAFELQYMGPPDTLSLDEMIEIAKSIE